MLGTLVKYAPTGAALLTVKKVIADLDLAGKIKDNSATPGQAQLGPGEYEMNIYPLSEVIVNPRLKNLGAVIKELQVPSIIQAVVSPQAANDKAVQALIKYLQSPALDPTLKSLGMDKRVKDGMLAVQIQAAQAQAQPVSVGNLKRYVSNLDKGVAIYRDVFGLELSSPPGQFAVNPQGQKATNTPGASYRVAFFNRPDRLTVWSSSNTRTSSGRCRRRVMRRMRATSPWCSTSGIWTRGGESQDRRVAHRHRRRPGDHACPRREQLEQPRDRLSRSGWHADRILQPSPLPEAAKAAPSNVFGSHTDIAVDNIEKMVAFYRDVLGFDMGPLGEPRRDEATMRLVGNETATEHPAFVTSAIRIDGRPISLSLIEFKGASHMKANFRPQDPGSMGFSLAVKDFASAVKASQASGTESMSVGGQPAMPVGDRGNQLMYFRDPNGTISELSQARAQ